MCNFPIGIQKQVADYGKLGERERTAKAHESLLTLSSLLAPGAKQLEFGTACNYGGYFLGKPNSCCCSRGHACIGGACCCDHIAMCLGDRDQKTRTYTGGCFYMSVWDDCAWPGVFDPAKKPAQVSIWRHKVSHAEAVGMLDESMERQLDVMSGALEAGEVV